LYKKTAVIPRNMMNSIKVLVFLGNIFGFNIVRRVLGLQTLQYNLTGVLEYEADEAGNSTLKVWEWK
jgi:hypothetical protein